MLNRTTVPSVSNLNSRHGRWQGYTKEDPIHSPSLLVPTSAVSADECEHPDKANVAGT